MKKVYFQPSSNSRIKATWFVLLFLGSANFLLAQIIGISGPTNVCNGEENTYFIQTLIQMVKLCLV